MGESPVRTYQLWVDIETTGLSPATAIPLEVGMRLTRTSGETVRSCTAFLPSPEGLRLLEDPAYTDKYVRDMHKESRLKVDYEKALRNSKNTYRSLEEGIAALDGMFFSWLDHAFREEVECAPGLMPICGSSVAFDRDFIKYYFPLTALMFHYRNVDTSAAREIVYMEWLNQFGPSSLEKLDRFFGVAGEHHRPQKDITDSIELYGKIATLLANGFDGV